MARASKVALCVRVRQVSWKLRLPVRVDVDGAAGLQRTAAAALTRRCWDVAAAAAEARAKARGAECVSLAASQRRVLLGQ
jgi:hypothetical protein